jgi:hypothetical protein
MQCVVERLSQLSAASKGFLEPLLLLTISSVEWSKTNDTESWPALIKIAVKF